ncbi:adenylyl-sulfate kinase [Demequina mangrovi]|uniref:Adenylyl-sulfate kinase n=1 Tax=Demequina mangrovi TaxID=1043493 RepID=A0A1H7A1M7_9MICO|nr:adenylyl-sulfate kinase [Demequina mangrovi]SEJ59388.1 adenylyl-sulfate kinase [Demequina mangrovi]
MQLRLSPAQLNELELMRAGAYGSELGYQLPTADAHVATLLVRDVAVPAAIDLLDTEATPIARVEVTGSHTTSSGTWIAGPVTMLREPAAPTFAESRPAAGKPLLEHATLVLGNDVRDGDGDLVLVDDGDAEALTRAMSAATRTGREVRVLPRPAAAHLSGDLADDLLTHLAEVVCASSITTRRKVRRARGNGAVVLLSGLSGSGKSTIARQLTRRLRAESHQRVTLLDGDEVRAMLSSGLGFSRADRELNVRRIGWVAAQLAAHGGIAVCAPIAPYETMRAEMRTMAEENGRFVLVHVATPLEVCEARDRKGLYAKARAGEIKEFTGISDPYETPVDADVVVGADGESVEEAAETVLRAVLHAEASYVI